jgi:hypothetical protein
MAKAHQNYLVHIEFGLVTPDRLSRVAPRVLEGLQDIAGKDYEMVWRSLDRSVIAYVIRTQRTAAQIRTRLTEPSDAISAQIAGVPHDKIKDWGTAVLSSPDKVAVLALGAEVAALGYGRLVGWITGHQS